MSSILVSQDSGVLTITLNRPDKLNAFNSEMHQLLRAALARAADEAAVRAASTTRVPGKRKFRMVRRRKRP